MGGRGLWVRLAIASVLGAVVVGLGADPAMAVEQPVSESPQPAGTEGGQPAQTEAPGGGGVVETDPDATTPPSGGSTEQPDVDPSEGEQPSGAEETPTPSPTPEGDASENDSGGIQPSIRRSGIPTTSILLAVGVLAAVALAGVVAARRAGALAGSSPPGTVDILSTPTTPATSTARTTRADPEPDAELLTFLLELGEALIDAGDAVNRVAATLRAVAHVQGLGDVRVIVLPTAIIVSIPGTGNAQTDITTAGASPLRLDQVEAVFRLVDTARGGRIEPSWGHARLDEIRGSHSEVPGALAMAGNALAAVGLAMILRGGAVEVALAGGLGAVVGVLQIARSSRQPILRPFLPLIAAFVVAVTVFLVTRIAPDLAILPPLIAPLIPFLPGALLTMGTVELATGEAVSGMARLGSGGLQLVLLAGGILGAVQFVGVPGPADVVTETSTVAPGGVVGMLAPWVGVVVFGLGIAWARAARRASVPWMLLVLYVAYAGQIVGGLYFGNGLSAFFGALAMTPVAIYLSRQRLGPPSLVTFLPAFWLLVPGALGLQGVTTILSEAGVQGISTLVTTGTAMIGIALGILLGILLVPPDRWRLPRSPGSAQTPG